MQSETVDNLNIDQIVLLNKNKMIKKMESTDHTNLNKNQLTDLYEFKAKVK